MPSEACWFRFDICGFWNWYKFNAHKYDSKVTQLFFHHFKSNDKSLLNGTTISSSHSNYNHVDGHNYFSDFWHNIEEEEIIIYRQNGES